MNFVDPDGESWGKALKVVKKVYKAAKTVGVSDAIVDGAKATDAVKNRVKLRKSTRTTIIEQAPKNADGDFIDPNTGMIVPKEGPFDIGHKRGGVLEKAQTRAPG